MQVICMSFTCIMYDTNMCRIMLLCQTDWISLRILWRGITLQRRQSWLFCQPSFSSEMKMRLNRSRRTVMINELAVIQSIIIRLNLSIYCAFLLHSAGQEHCSVLFFLFFFYSLCHWLNLFFKRSLVFLWV